MENTFVSRTEFEALKTRTNDLEQTVSDHVTNLYERVEKLESQLVNTSDDPSNGTI